MAYILPVIFTASATFALASLTHSTREPVRQWPVIRRALLSLEF